MNRFINHVYNGSLYTSSGVPLIILVPISIVHLIVCFALMGVLSSDFLASNINSLCDSSGILVTILLSFCNSSPDIISNFVAWTSSKTVQENTDFLAFSEVLGACGTIICIAQGLVLITIARIVRKKIFTIETVDDEDDNSDIPSNMDSHSEEELNRTVRHMLKKMLADLSFFAAAMCLMLICVFAGKISVFNCFAMLFLYGAYLFYNYKQHKLGQQVTKDSTTQPSASIQLEDYNTNDRGSLDDNTMEEEIVRYNYTHNPNYIQSIDYSVFLDLLEGSDSNISESSNIEVSTNNNVGNKSKDHEPKDDKGSTRPFSAPEFTTGTNSERYTDGSRWPISEPGTLRPYSDFEQDNTREPLTSQEGIEQQEPIIFDPTVTSHKTRERSLYNQFHHRWTNFKRKKLYRQILIVSTTPMLLCIHASCPRLDKSVPATSKKFSQLICQSLLTPFFTVFSLAVFFGKFNWLVIGLLSAVLSIALIGLQLLMHNQLKEYTKVTLKPQVGKRRERLKDDTQDHLSESLQSIIDWEQEFRVFLKIFAIFGVVNSLLWIVILANNLIGIIQYYQEITQISESILGLTFFAWGNSIADILSNLAILKLYNTKMDNANGDHKNKKLTSLLKFATISIGSCVGGCLINTMIGVGLNSLIAIILDKQHSLRVVYADPRFTWVFHSMTRKGFLHICVSSLAIVSTIFLLIGLLVVMLLGNRQCSAKTLCVSYLHKLGIVLVSFWMTTTLVNVLIEILV